MKRTLSALIASIALVGCSQDDAPISPAPEPSSAAATSAPASSAVAPAANKTESNASAEDINDAITDGEGATNATPDEFVFVEQHIGQLISVLPPDVQVKGDPKGLDKVVAVDIPASLQGAELEQAMNSIQPIAIQGFQEHQIRTQVGRRDDGVLTIIDAWTYDMDKAQLADQYTMAKTNTPVIKNHFDYARISPLFFVMNDFNYYDNAGCVDALRNIKDTFPDDQLNLSGQELFYKIPDCGGVSVVIHGYAKLMDTKVEKIANILAAQGTVPEGTQLKVHYSGNLDVVVPAPAELGIKDRVQPFWNLGEVSIKQY